MLIEIVYAKGRDSLVQVFEPFDVPIRNIAQTEFHERELGDDGGKLLF